MADEDIMTEDQLLGNLDDTNNGDAEFLNEVNAIRLKYFFISATTIFIHFQWNSLVASFFFSFGAVKCT